MACWRAAPAAAHPHALRVIFWRCAMRYCGEMELIRLTSSPHTSASHVRLIQEAKPLILHLRPMWLSDD